MESLSNIVESLSSYHSLGLISASLFTLTWYGLWKQLNLLNQLKASEPTGFTRSLSLNQFASSYFAFYANYFFGIALPEFNHYLVWTRLGALVLLLGIMFRIAQDRHKVFAWQVFFVSLFMLLATSLLATHRPLPEWIALSSDIVMLVVTAILAQGTWAQIRKLERYSDQSQALSKPMLQSILLKDATTLAFAFTIPLHESWPLILLNGTSITLRGYLYWVLSNAHKASNQSDLSRATKISDPSD